MSRYMVLLYADEAGLPKPGGPEFDAQNAAYAPAHRLLRAGVHQRSASRRTRRDHPVRVSGDGRGPSHPSDV